MKFQILSFYSYSYLFYCNLFNLSLTSVKLSFLTNEFSFENSNFLLGLGVSDSKFSEDFKIFFIYLACLCADSNNSYIVLPFGLSYFYFGIFKFYDDNVP